MHNKYRLDAESVEIRDLRSDATAQGPQLSKSRISIGRAASTRFRLRTGHWSTEIQTHALSNGRLSRTRG